MSELVLIFKGSDFESQILKSQLEDAGVKALLKSQTNSAAIAGFGSIAASSVYINQGDSENAAQVIEAFKANNRA